MYICMSTKQKEIAERILAVIAELEELMGPEGSFNDFTVTNTEATVVAKRLI